MKTKLKTEENTEGVNLLSLNQNQIKTDIINEIKLNGAIVFRGQIFKNNAEKFRIGIIQSLELNNVKNISIFLNEYIKILEASKFPLSNAEIVLLIYNSWNCYSAFIDNLVYFSHKLPCKIESSNFWKVFILSCNKNKVNNKFHFFLLIAIFSKIKSYENSITKISKILNLVFSLPVNNNYRISDSDFEKRAKKDYRKIITWIDWVYKGKVLTEDEKNASIIIMLETINEDPEHILFAKKEKAFVNFYNLLKSRFSPIIIFNTPAKIIELAFFCNSQNPELFSSQKFFIKDNIDFPNCNKSNILIMSFFREHHFPTIFLNNLADLSNEEKNWFIHVLKGNNIRTYVGLPFKPTKKASHIFSTLYTNYLTQEEFAELNSFNYNKLNALIYSQLRANEVAHGFAKEAFRRINFQDHPENISYWIDTLSLLSKQNISPEILVAIIDYLDYHVIRRKEVVNLKGKSKAKLLHEINIWHKLTAEEKLYIEYATTKFKPIPINDFELEVTSKKFKIKQILTAIELFLEGKTHHHCVFSYLGEIQTKSCSIFSMQVNEENGNQTRLLTIEVSHNTIQQIRGAFNRGHNQQEMKIIKLWAKEENLKIAV